ncbi:hypothetical protein C0Q70_03366 [Pomacea canaliculata]|uniref:Ig-like domain-containing protein n=1 Tax=Pomacea canaliculata TaxID=400727 RepID=A0A2T7PSJ5_POMCA|nr:hypothetical protein C0Q70_03366 [Pomacea canaliculata]
MLWLKTPVKGIETKQVDETVFVEFVWFVCVYVCVCACPNVPHCISCRSLCRSLVCRAASELSGEVVTGPTPEAKISFLLPDTIYGFIVSSYSVGGESEPSEELLVQTLPAEPPMILQLLATVVVEGSTANLTCVVRAEPPPEVQWFAPNKTVPFSSQASTNLGT